MSSSQPRAAKFVSLASSIKIKQWLNRIEPEKVMENKENIHYRDLLRLIDEIVEEDSKWIVAALFERMSEKFLFRSKTLCEEGKKRRREVEASQHPPSPEL